MSLINDVLLDLETRQAPGGESAALAGLRAVRHVPVPGRRWLLPLAAVAAASSAFALYGLHDSELDEVSAVTPAIALQTEYEQVPRTTPYATLVEFTRSLDARGRVPAAEVAAGESRPLLSAAHEPRNDDVQSELPRAAASQANEPVKQESRERATLPAPAAAIADAPAVEPARDSSADSSSTVKRAALTSDQQLRRDADTALATGNASLAAERLATLTDRRPSDTDAWLERANAAALAAGPLEAEAVLMQGLHHAADPARVARALAHRLLARQAERESLGVLEAYRPAGRLDAEHEAFVAALRQRSGDHEGAAERYRAVLAVQPENGAWWVGLAISEEHLGHRGPALDAYLAARRLGNLDARLDTYARERIAVMQGTESS